jgi:endonuclease YncB( thermonuclease family)
MDAREKQRGNVRARSEIGSPPRDREMKPVLQFSRCLAALVLFLSATAAGADLTGRVVHIADGDTLTLLTESNQQIRIRLSWIDAPELGQAFGNVSREALAELVAGKTVQVEQVDIDRYGRTVGTVFVDGRDVCLAQVQAGLAWVYDHYIVNAPVTIQSQYYEAQEKARTERKGLWQDSNPVAPWIFRHQKSARMISNGPADASFLAFCPPFSARNLALR